MKKSMRRKTAVLLSLAMAATAFPSGMTGALADDGLADPAVLFSSSFEEGERHTLLETQLSDKGASHVNGVFTFGTLKGDITNTVDMDSIAGSADFNSNESKPKLFDYSTGSKFLNQHSSINKENPVWVSFALKKEAVVRTYLIASANDEPSRDPKDWTLYGSTDNQKWTALDSRSGQTFSERKQEKVYTFENETAYKYYKLEITANNGQGMTQLSSLELGTGEDGALAEGPMQTVASSGPLTAWVGTTGTGWTGDGALQICGTHEGSAHGYSYNVLYDNLQIPVSKNTELSYVFFPAMQGEYDYDYTSMHMAVDLQFTDGTYLSDCKPTDQYGNSLTPEAQADCKFWNAMQWNYIRSSIGSVAAGKTIEKILVGYDNSDPAAADTKFLAYMDDIVIENAEEASYENLTDYVDIRRGSNSGGASNFSRGLIQPVVTTPHGFNQFEPCTGNGDGNMQYRYQQGGSNTTLKHISVNHFSSNWIGEYGTWQFMANTSIDATAVAKGEEINAAARAADFSHDNEIAKAHLYSVTFDEGSKAAGVTMEVTPTEHAAFARFVFPEGSENHNVILDCERAAGGLTLNEDGSFTAYSDHTANGSKRMYVYGVFMNEANSRKVVNGKQGIVSFPAAASGDTIVTMKFATSFISADQAQKNLELEIADDDTFDTVCAAAQKTWEDKLGIIEIEGATEEQMITFYSNMYRMFAYPMNYSENTGNNETPAWKYASPYSGSNTAPDVKDGKLYAINGFWDTYRTTWAAYALLTPEKDAEMLNGLVQHYNDVGWVPRWIAPGGTNSMVGTNSDVIFGDAAQRGIDFDWEGALLSSIRNAAVVSTSDVFGRKQMETSVFRGYTSTSQGEGFSWSMESYINDYGISQLAKAITEKGTADYSAEIEYYLNRAQNYVNLYNADLGWFMGKNDNGTFRETNAANYNPQSWWGDYTETNGYNMAFTVPQDGQGLANLYGGREGLAEKLDGLFNTQCQGTRIASDTVHEELEAREVKMGLYGHSNQPSHHIPYMYNYAGQPWKTQEKVREVLDRLYIGSEIGQGYCGDEDNGEMSAWYVLSALGIYPVSMGNPEFAIGSPLFTKATIHLENGKDMVITANNNSRENIYVQSVKLNGQAYDKNYILHADLAAGGTLEFEMGSQPSKWGSSEDALPTSITKDDQKPNPAADVIVSNVTTAVRPNYSTLEDQLSSREIPTADLRMLVDNTSGSYVSYSGKEASIYFISPTLYEASGFTVTSGVNKSQAPTSVALYGSNDGRTWEKLTEEADLSFQWEKYTRPFWIDAEKQASYKAYRLDLATTGSGMQLAEVELLGRSPFTADRTELDKVLREASLLNQSKYTPDSWAKLQKAIDEAENLAADASQDNVDDAAKAIRQAIDELEIAFVAGDLDKDGEVTIADVMEACKVLARKSAEIKPTADEIARGDLDDDGDVTIADVMEICKILARQN